MTTTRLEKSPKKRLETVIVLVIVVGILADTCSAAHAESFENWLRISKNAFPNSRSACQIGIPSLRGGGVHNNHGNPVPKFQPPAVLAGVPSLWRERLLPVIQVTRNRIQDSLLHQQAYKTTSASSNTTDIFGRRKESSDSLSETFSSRKDIPDEPVSSPSTSMMSTKAAMSLLSFLRPSRVARLSLLAFVIAEVLDRLGVLYEDTPSILKSQLEAFWYYDVEPTLMLWKAHLQQFYALKIRPHLPSFLRHDNLSSENLRSNVLSFLSTTKVAFTVGASLGMISSPVFVQCAVRYWKPILAVYSLAEANHYCKRQGKKLVQRLGDTPQTLGATLDGMLEQCRNLVRRVVLGTKAVKDGSIVVLTGTPPAEGRGAAVSLLGGGDSNQSTPSEGSPRRNAKWGLPSSNDQGKRSKVLGYSLGLSSSMSVAPAVQEDDEGLVDLQGLVDEFKQWMVVHPGQNQELSLPDLVDEVGGRNAKGHLNGEMMKHGFWAGCAIGLASLGF